MAASRAPQRDAACIVCDAPQTNGAGACGRCGFSLATLGHGPAPTVAHAWGASTPLSVRAHAPATTTASAPPAAGTSRAVPPPRDTTSDFACCVLCSAPLLSGPGACEWCGYTEASGVADAAPERQPSQPPAATPAAPAAVSCAPPLLPCSAACFALQLRGAGTCEWCGYGAAAAAAAPPLAAAAAAPRIQQPAVAAPLERDADFACCIACGAPQLQGPGECQWCGFDELPCGDEARSVSPPALPATAQWGQQRRRVDSASPVVDVDELPPLGALRIGASAAGAAPACLACSPLRRCPAHPLLKQQPKLAARRVTDAEQLLATSPPTQALRGQRGALKKDGDAAYAYVAPQLDAAARQAVLSAASAASSACASAPHYLSVEAQRMRMGGDKARAAQRLDTSWTTEANDPRSRVRAMLAAGWRPVQGTMGGHPRWERVLEAGPHAGTRQVINFSGTYSTFCWASQSGDLARMDRDARGE